MQRRRQPYKEVPNRKTVRARERERERESERERERDRERERESVRERKSNFQIATDSSFIVANCEAFLDFARKILQEIRNGLCRSLGDFY